VIGRRRTCPTGDWSRCGVARAEPSLCRVESAGSCGRRKLGFEQGEGARESRLKTVHGSGSRKRGFTQSTREALAPPPSRPATRALWALANAAFGHSEAALWERVGVKGVRMIYARFALRARAIRYILVFP